MQKNITDAVIVHCIDFRFQKHFDAWIAENFGCCNYDRVSLAGGVFDFDYMLKQIEISEELHDINQIVLINHEDCGAYGSEGNHARHKSDLEKSKQKLEILFPTLGVDIYYLHLDGEFEKVS